jgi:hypothetical protein
MEQSLPLDVPVKHWVVIFEGMPVLLSDGEPCAFSMSLVDK